LPKIQTRVQILMARSSRLQQQIGSVSSEIQRHNESAQAQARSNYDNYWVGEGRKNADVAKTPTEAARVLRKTWEQCLASASAQHPGESADYIRGMAAGSYNRRVAALKAARKAAADAGEGEGGELAKPADEGRIIPPGRTQRPAQPARTPEDELVATIGRKRIDDFRAG
jgi:hypothetical protein